MWRLKDIWNHFSDIKNKSKKNAVEAAQAAKARKQGEIETQVSHNETSSYFASRIFIQSLKYFSTL